MKITLMDIMESLNSDNIDDAQSALHEWFVDQSRQVHGRLTAGPVTEATGAEDETIEEAKVPVDDAAAEKNAADGSETPGEVDGDLDESVDVTESSDEEVVEESEDDLIADLAESFAGLETVSDKLQNQEGAQVGEQGKVPVNTKAALPSHKGKDRMGGEPVEIKGKGHTGHAMEKSPKVQDAPVKHHVQNSKDDPKKVPSNNAALLNKVDGSVNTRSPISGKGATGLKK
jgi:hypothetical protein